MNAVIYARVSTGEQAKGHSVDTQLIQCREFCRAQGIAIIGEFGDPGKSGTSMAKRPGWQEMQRRIEAGGVDTIVATMSDRLHRNDHEWELFKRGVLKPRGIRVALLIGLPEESSGNEDPMMWYAQKMGSITNELYSRITSHKTRHGMRTRAAQGYHLSKPPYGTQTGAVKGVPVKHPEEWPALVRIFELAGHCRDYGEIMRACAKEGLPSRGRAWSHDTIRQILRNAFYVGEIHYRGETFSALHDCRVDPVLWERAQRPVNPNWKRGRKPADYQYLIANVYSSQYVVTLGSRTTAAGSPLPFRPKFVYGRGGRLYHVYYRADRLRRHGGLESAPLPGADPDLTSVRADLLDEAVVKELIRFADGDTSGLLLRDIDDAGRRMRDSAAAELADAKRRRQLLLQKVERLEYRATEILSADGDLPEMLAILERNIADLAQQRRAVDNEIRLLGQRLSGLEEAPGQELRRQVNLIREHWAAGNFEELRRLCDALIAGVDLRADGAYLYLRTMPATITIDLKPPLSIIMLLLHGFRWRTVRRSHISQ